MIAKMTSNLGQIVLAALAALALTFPSPEDAKQAFKDVVFGEPESLVVAAPDTAIFVSPEVSHVSAYASANEVDCLVSGPGMTEAQLRRCITQLFTELTTSPLANSPSALSASMRRDADVTDIYETKHLTLTKLCRALWVSSQGDMSSLDAPACAYVVEGLENT